MSAAVMIPPGPSVTHTAVHTAAHASPEPQSSLPSLQHPELVTKLCGTRRQLSRPPFNLHCPQGQHPILAVATCPLPGLLGKHLLHSVVQLGRPHPTAPHCVPKIWRLGGSCHGPLPVVGGQSHPPAILFAVSGGKTLCLLHLQPKGQTQAQPSTC